MRCATVIWPSYALPSCSDNLLCTHPRIHNCRKKSSPGNYILRLALSARNKSKISLVELLPAPLIDGLLSAIVVHIETIDWVREVMDSCLFIRNI